MFSAYAVDIQAVGSLPNDVGVTDSPQRTTMPERESYNKKQGATDMLYAIVLTLKILTHPMLSVIFMLFAGAIVMAADVVCRWFNL